MSSFKFLQPLDLMERISRTEIGARLDEIIELIDENNVGYVITDEGKDDLVICPASWFMCTFDDDFGCMINSAVRYSIGRETYMPSTAMDFVRKYIHVLDTRTIRVMIEDIERSLPDDKLPYKNDWVKLCDDLKTHYATLARENEKENGSASE